MTTSQTKPAAPVAEIGYAQAPNYNWWLYQDETTPELQWPQSISVYDAMRRTDAQVTSVLRAMTLPVRSTPWRIDPNGASDEVTEFVADNLGLPIVGQEPKSPLRQQDRFSWDEHLRQALLMLPFGHMYFEQTYRIDEDGRARLRKLGPRMPKTISQIDVAEDGGLISITQYWTAVDRKPQPIPVNRLVAYIHEKEGGNWLGSSILRPGYKNWLLKDRLLRVWAQTIERNGMGVPRYTGAEGEASLAQGLAMARAWRSGESAGTAIPFGSALDLVGVNGTLPDAEPAVRYHDEQLGRAVLAHFLNLGTQTGSWALGTTFADFFTLSLQSLAQQVEQVGSLYIIEDLVDVNWGPDEPAPRLICDEIGSRQPATAQSLVALFGAGALTPDARLEESLRQQYGLPPKEQPADATGTAAPLLPPDQAQAQGQPEPVLAGGVGPKGVDQPVSAPIDDDDDDEPGQLDTEDVDTAALVAALAAFCGEVHAAAEFNDKLHPRGAGGRFRNTFARIVRALEDWENGDSPSNANPFEGHGFTREQLRDAAKKRGVTLRHGAPEDEIVKALMDDVRAKHGDTKAKATDAGKPVRFTLKGKDHRDLDVGVFTEPSGKLSLWEVSDSGERRRRVALVDNLAGLQAWADEHGESELAGWAKERGGGEAPKAPDVPAKTARKAAKKAAPKAAPAAEPVDTSRPVKPYGTEAEASALTSADHAALLRAGNGLDDARTIADKTDAIADLTTPQLRSLAVGRWIDPDEFTDHDALVKAVAGQLATPDVLEGIDADRRTGSADKVHGLAAERVAKNWDVSAQDLEALIREDKAWDHYKDLPFDEQKQLWLKGAFHAYDSGAYGSPPVLMAMAAASRHAGIEYTTRLQEQHFIDYAAERPALKRATDSLGVAIYDTTQQWFRDHGYTTVRMRRYTRTPDAERGNLYRAWSVPGGGQLHQAFDGDAESYKHIEEDIPVERIFSIPVTGPGSPEEAEVVVLSSRGKVAAPNVPAKATPAKKAAKAAPPSGADPEVKKITDRLQSGEIDVAEATRLLEEHGRLRQEAADKAAGRAEPGNVFKPLPLPTKKATKAAPKAAPDVNALRTLDTEARRDALDLRKVEGPDGLKALLREQGLPVSGRKRDLVDRLVAHFDVPKAGGVGPKDDAPPVGVDLAVAVQSGVADRETLSGGDMGTVELVTHNNGTKTVRKKLEDVSEVFADAFPPERQADAEELTAALGQAINAPIPRVLRTAPDEVHIEHVDGEVAVGIKGNLFAAARTTEEFATVGERAAARTAEIAGSPEGVRLGVLDILTGNWDRANTANWLVTPDGKPVGIDHSFTFFDDSEAADPPPLESLGPFAGLFVRPGTGPKGRNGRAAVEWKDNPLTPADVDWLRARLAAVEDDFTRAGRHDWWEFASARLEAIAPFATATESRLT